LKRSSPAGYKAREPSAIALDRRASSEFYDKAHAKYLFKKSDKFRAPSPEMLVRGRTGGEISQSCHLVWDAEDDGRGWKTLDGRRGQQDFEKNFSACGRRSVCDQPRTAVALHHNEGISNAILTFTQIGTSRTIDGDRTGSEGRIQLDSFHPRRRTKMLFIYLRGPLAVANRCGQIKTVSWRRAPTASPITKPDCCAAEEDWEQPSRFSKRKSTAAVVRCTPAAAGKPSSHS